MSTNGAAICLLDDDASVLKATSRMLSYAGCRAQSFTDPMTFLAYACDHQLRVAVLDMLMPAMNGLEVQRRLRDVSPSTRVIILSSQDDPMVRGRAMDAGVYAFFNERSGSAGASCCNRKCRSEKLTEATNVAV